METKQELKKIEKKVVKLRNKLGRADLDYLVQVSINSTDPTVVTYAMQITAPANGLAPIAFVTKSAKELIERVELATKEINYEEVEKAYHLAQIKACERTIIGHRERITEIETEDVDVAVEEVAVEETVQNDTEE